MIVNLWPKVERNVRHCIKDVVVTHKIVERIVDRFNPYLVSQKANQARIIIILVHALFFPPLRIRNTYYWFRMKQNLEQVTNLLQTAWADPIGR